MHEEISKQTALQQLLATGWQLALIYPMSATQNVGKNHHIVKKQQSQSAALCLMEVTKFTTFQSFAMELLMIQMVKTNSFVHTQPIFIVMIQKIKAIVKEENLKELSVSMYSFTSLL